VWGTLNPSVSLASDASQQTGLTAAEAAIIAAAIAGLIALLTSWLNFVIQRKLSAKSEGTQRELSAKSRAMASRTARADRITEQLSKLYGPLRLLIAQSGYLAAKLREGKTDPANWHLLDNLTTVVADPADRAIAQQIVAVNTEVERLVLAHAGLLKDGEVPTTFVLFLGHCRFLKIAFDAARKQKQVPGEFTAKQFEYFPVGFDRDVRTAYEALREERKALLAQ
jgi:hypothetical protein